MPRGKKKSYHQFNNIFLAELEGRTNVVMILSGDLTARHFENQNNEVFTNLFCLGAIGHL